MRKVTFREIAARAEVSPSAVSIVLNGQKGVGEGTRAKVLKAARELGYVRKPIPQSGAVEAVRLVIYQKHGLVVDKTPFFNAVLDGIGQFCRDLGTSLQVYYVQEKDGNERRVQAQLVQNDDLGAILLATEMNRQDVVRWMEAVPRLVVLDSYFDLLKVDTVAIDNQEGAYAAVQHLINRGYTDIGYLHSAVWINNFSERETGVRQCLADGGLAMGTLIPLSSTLEGARRDMLAYLERGGRVSRALFADNDIIAVGALGALKARGLRIPQDVEIVGFDESPCSEQAVPPLSTCRVFKHTLGRTAGARLLSLRAGQGGAPMKIRVSTELIVR